MRPPSPVPPPCGGRASRRQWRGRRGLLLVLLLLLPAACGDEAGRAPEPSPDAPLSAADEERLAQAFVLLQRGLPEQVHAVLAELLGRDPVPAAAQYLAGQAAYGLGQWGEAVARLEDAVARDPGRFLQDANSLGFAHYKLGQFAEARAVFQAILEADPGETKARYGLGQLALTEGRWEEAREELGRVLDAEPGHFKARFALARTLEALGDDEGALTEAAAVVAAAPAHDEALFLMATLLGRLGREEDARAAMARRDDVYAVREQLAGLEQRLRAGEDTPILRLQMVDALVSLGDVAGAARLLAAARARFPGDAMLAEAEQRLAAAVAAGGAGPGEP